MKMIVWIFLWGWVLHAPVYVRAAWPSITDYWNGQADFRFYKSLTQDDPQWESGSDAGVHVEVAGDTWYLFTRLVHWGNKPSYCSTELMSLVVRKSNDKGNTWSAPVEILSNTPETTGECAATDGDAYYNQIENRWHYLYQCLDRKGIWNGCHAIRNGADPYGVFTPDTANPMITSREIWSKICTDPASDCYQLSQMPTWGILDEGTFDIFDYQNGRYLVSFHGTDGVRGYRGLATTNDFQNWTPIVHDATLDLKDALAFSTPWDAAGPIGFGAARIMKDKGSYYMVVEAADKNLNCTAGQHWVVGMFRSASLTSTTWSQLPKRNPFFTIENFPTLDPNPLPCNPEYSGMFVDRAGKWYFHTSRPSYTPSLSGIYLYELMPKIEGDFNLDGRVDFEDISTILSGFGMIHGVRDFGLTVSRFGY